MERELEVGEARREALLVHLCAPHRGVEVVEDEVTHVRVVGDPMRDVLVEVVGVQAVDHLIDVHLDARLVRVVDGGEGALECSGCSSQLGLDLGPHRVDAHVHELQPRIGHLLRERSVGQAVSIGDHPDVQPTLARVGGDAGKLRMERRLPAGEDHAEITPLGEVVDQQPHRLEVVRVGRRRVGAEATEVVAVPDDLDVAEVGQARSVAGCGVYKPMAARRASSSVRLRRVIGRRSTIAARGTARTKSTPFGARKMRWRSRTPAGSISSATSTWARFPTSLFKDSARCTCVRFTGRSPCCAIPVSAPREVPCQTLWCPRHSSHDASSASAVTGVPDVE